MPNWSQVLDEIKNHKQEHPLDYVRRKYLKELSDYTGRNVIAYYSGWLQKTNSSSVNISDDDKNGFMATINGLNRNKGLDLILHTPGGEVAATESIVDYLKTMFKNDIRAIIPQIAMSAGTMIACACKEIFMGKQSSIGPIDPHFGNIPACGVIEEFNTALEEIKKDPESIPIWQVIISKYHPTFIGECQKAIELSQEIVSKWLKENMYIDDSNKDKKVDKIIRTLCDHNISKMHSRHIGIEQATELGLKIVPLESDPDIQDLVLTVHHAYMHTFASSHAIRIIENHDSNGIIYNYVKEA